MRKGLRRAGRLTVAAGMLTFGALSPVRGAGALEHETVKYDPGPGKPYSYHADVVMAPTDGGTFTDPDTCAAVTWCTMVPLELTPLQRDDLNDWVVEVDIAWDDSRVQGPNEVGAGQESNDLDTYLYYFGQVVDADGNPEKNEDGTPKEDYVEAGRSAGGKSPEIIKLFRPTKGKYFLVVTNFVGVNHGFDLTFSTTSSGDGVGTLIDDTPPASTASAAGADRLSFGDEPPAAQFAAPTPSPVVKPPAFHDSDFGFAAAVPDDLLEGDEGPTRGSLFAEEIKAPPADVGGGTLLLWLVLLPLLILASATAFLVRRRPSALSIRFPVRRTPAAEPVVE